MPVPEKIIGEYGASGAAIKEYVYLNGQPIALLDGADVNYVHTDHLGTPRAVSDSSGTVIWRWDSTPFGETVADEDPDGDGQAYVYNQRFPGQYYDGETGLHYNYFRDYDALSGRYVESDPIGLDGGINTFGYVGNDPASYADAQGLFRLRCNYLNATQQTKCSFEFEGCVSGFISSTPFRPTDLWKKAAKRSRQAKKALGGTSSGIDDIENFWDRADCRCFDGELKKLFESKGHQSGRFTGTRLTPNQTRNLLDEFRDKVKDEDCGSCKYPWDKLIDLALERSPSRHIKNY